MQNVAEILRLRVLLCFLNLDEKDCTVTNIARILGEEKYTITRALDSLQKKGYVVKNESRIPKLTEYGMAEAKRYNERIEVTINHLMYEGVDIDNARNDALHWALHNSERTMEVIEATKERYRVKYELRDKKAFSGSVLCKKLKDGVYNFPFLFYRESVKNGSNISMANEGFEHPCTLIVENGVGTIRLRAISTTRKSANQNRMLEGRVRYLEYLDCGNFVKAEFSANIVSFPASVLNFINVGSGTEQILHGSVCMKMIANVEDIHMPESIAVFTIMI